MVACERGGDRDRRRCTRKRGISLEGGGEQRTRKAALIDVLTAIPCQRPCERWKKRDRGGLHPVELAGWERGTRTRMRRETGGAEGQRGGRSHGGRKGGLEAWMNGGIEGKREGRINGRREGQTDGWLDGRTEKWTCGQRDGGMDGCKDIWTGGQADERMERWMDRGKRGQRDGGMDGGREERGVDAGEFCWAGEL